MKAHMLPALSMGHGQAPAPRDAATCTSLVIQGALVPGKLAGCGGSIAAFLPSPLRPLPQILLGCEGELPGVGQFLG